MTTINNLAAGKEGNPGYCPICETEVYFEIGDGSLRDHYRCSGCNSIPRWRAMMMILNEQYPNWRELRIHESSPCGPLSRKLKAESRDYTGSHYFADQALGSIVRGFRNEDITHQTFSENAFDLVITSDVFEHVFDARKGFSEISRTLKPGGAHIFTVPWFHDRRTKVRACCLNGQIEHLHPPDYHGNPISKDGSLVVTEWGCELPFLISEWSGLPTAVFRYIDRGYGLDGKLLEVFVSRKPEGA